MHTFALLALLTTTASAQEAATEERTTAEQPSFSPTCPEGCDLAAVKAQAKAFTTEHEADAIEDAALSEAFEKADKNGDGTLAGDEVSALVINPFGGGVRPATGPTVSRPNAGAR